MEQVRAAAGARAACPQRPQLPLRLRRRLGNIHALVSASAAWRGSASGSGIQLYEELDLVDSSSLFKYFFDRVRRGMNSGVMYINVKNATQYADGLIEYAGAKGYRSFSTADQVTKLTRIKTTAIHRGYSHY